MKYKIASFESVVSGVRDNTGITDLRNREPEIRRLIARAEKEINPYSGFMIRKKVRYHKGSPYFDGKNFKKPEDFVELDVAGCCDDAICPGTYFETDSHIVFCDGKNRDHITLTFWALNCDGRGNPVTTENHLEAVIAFIVYIFYGQKVFLGQGNAGMRREYKYEWQDLAMASRGYDAFPSEWQLQGLYYRYMAPAHLMEYGNSSRYEKLIMCECYAIEDMGKPDEQSENQTDDIKVTWGQIKGSQLIPMTTELAESIVSSPEESVQFYRDEISLTQAMNGFTFAFQRLGRYYFIIDGVENNSIEIYDLLMQSMGDSLDMIYDSSKKRLIFYSQFYITASNIYFKFVYNEG